MSCKSQEDVHNIWSKASLKSHAVLKYVASRASGKFPEDFRYVACKVSGKFPEDVENVVSRAFWVEVRLGRKFCLALGVSSHSLRALSWVRFGRKLATFLPCREQGWTVPSVEGGLLHCSRAEQSLWMPVAESNVRKWSL